nr:hypothetical protein [Allomuricauda sp.]
MRNLTKNTTESIQDLIVQMERNHTAVQRFSKKVNSYTCEPTNSSCFEKLYELRQAFKVFIIQQNRIMGLLKQRKVGAQNLKSDILQQLERFKQLEQDIAAYLLATNPYS